MAGILQLQADHTHQCLLCGKVAKVGPTGRSSHGETHVRRGEAEKSIRFVRAKQDARERPLTTYRATAK